VDINERIINESSDVPRGVTAKHLMTVRSIEVSDFSQAATRFTKTAKLGCKMFVNKCNVFHVVK